MIKVLIVDDHPMIRRRLRQALEETGDIVVAGEVCDGLAVLNEVAHNDFDVVLLDLSMPGQSGLETLQRLHHDRPGLHVLFLSDYREEEYVCRILSEGASGYLTKDSVVEELVTAIRDVACGKKYVPSALSEKLAMRGTPLRQRAE
jgi:DNA-binding NarL/FixJ family response regulator